MHPAIGTKFPACVFFVKLLQHSHRHLKSNLPSVRHMLLTRTFFTAFISWIWRRQTWCEHNSHKKLRALGQRFSVFFRDLDETWSTNVGSHHNWLCLTMILVTKIWWESLGSKLTEQWFFRHRKVLLFITWISNFHIVYGYLTLLSSCWILPSTLHQVRLSNFCIDLLRNRVKTTTNGHINNILYI
jgi:hypothetical protein